MPRFFFDLQCDNDTYGTTLPDIPSARRVAVRYAGEVLRDLEVGQRGGFYWRMDVRQDDGSALFSLVLDLVPATAAWTNVQAPSVDAGRDEDRPGAWV